MAFSVDKGSPEELLTSFVSDLSFWEVSPVNKEEEEAIETSERLVRRLSSLSSTTSSREEKRKQRSKSKKKTDPEEAVWMPATDPVTGRTYYYHRVTRATQWEKVSFIHSGLS